MTEITDLSTTDSSNTSISGESLDGAIANMGRMDNTLQATMGMLARSIRTSVMRIIDVADATKRIAFDLSGIPTATTETVVVGASGLFAGGGAISPVNHSLAASVAGNALTVSLKGADGNDPSAGNPVYLPFRNATLATGSASFLKVTAATSLVISSGSTMGFASGIAGRIWIVGFNDGGTLRIGAINCLSGLNVYPLAGNFIASSTAEGGAGAADSAWVFYTGTAVTSKAYVILGYFDWSSGLATAGTWNAGPTTIKIFTPGDKKPGDVVQQSYGTYTTNADITASIPLDDTIPQNTEGTQIISVGPLVPSSAANVWRARFVGQITPLSVGDVGVVAIFSTNPGAGAIASTWVRPQSASSNASAMIEAFGQWGPGTTSAQTVTVRAGASGGVRFNGNSTGRFFGGSSAATLSIEEVMS